MQAKLEHFRANVTMGVLWKCTGVSAFLHGLLIAALCGVSYLGFQKRETASKAKAAADEAAAKGREEEAAKAAKAAGTAPVVANDPKNPDVKPAATPAPAAQAPVEPDPAAKKQADAEKTLGIDKVAKPDEMPKSPFSSKGDDLLKDLK